MVTGGESRKNTLFSKILNHATIGYLIFITGILLTALSFDFQNNTLAIISTSLVFWGAILVYFKPKDYVSKDILNLTIAQYYQLIDKLKKTQKYQNKPVYYSPSNIFGQRNTIISITKENYMKSELEEITSYPSNQLYNEKSLILIPPGQALSNKIEDKHGENFSSMELMNAINILENSIINENELAKNIAFEKTESYLNVTINGSAFNDLYKIESIHQTLREIGDPIISCIACALTRATHRPVTINELEKEKNVDKINVKLEIYDDTIIDEKNVVNEVKQSKESNAKKDDKD